MRHPNRHYGRPCRPGEFMEEEHEYINYDTGEIIVSVSTICHPPIPYSDALVAGGDRGKVVHAIAAAIMDGLPPPCPVDFEGYLQAMRGWHQHYFRRFFEVKSYVIEQPWVSPSGFAGTADYVAILKDGRTLVLDFKTSKPAGWHMDQLAGYGLLYGPDKPSQTVSINVYLQADGSWSIRERSALEGLLGFAAKAKEYGVII